MKAFFAAIVAAAVTSVTAHCTYPLTICHMQTSLTCVQNTDTLPDLILNGAATSDWEYVRQTENYETNMPVGVPWPSYTASQILIQFTGHGRHERSDPLLRDGHSLADVHRDRLSRRHGRLPGQRRLLPPRRACALPLACALLLMRCDSTSQRTCRQRARRRTRTMPLLVRRGSRSGRTLRRSLLALTASRAP